MLWLQLFLRVGSQCVPLKDDVEITVDELTAADRILTITKAGRTIATLRYAIDLTQKFDFDLTPGVEDEDFDFGLFVYNIHKSDERQRILLGLD